MATYLVVVGIAAVAAFILSRGKTAKTTVPILSRLAGDKQQATPVSDTDSFESIMLLKKRLKLSGATPQQIHQKLDPLILQLLDDPPETAAVVADTPAATTGAVTK